MQARAYNLTQQKAKDVSNVMAYTAYMFLKPCKVLFDFRDSHSFIAGKYFMLLNLSQTIL